MLQPKPKNNEEKHNKWHKIWQFNKLISEHKLKDYYNKNNNMQEESNKNNNNLHQLHSKTNKPKHYCNNKLNN